MAKRKQVEPREETRKQTVRRRKDAEMNRRVVIGLLAVGALLVILIAAGVIQELVIKPNQPVAIVDNNRVTTREFQKLVRYSWYQSDEVTDPQGTSIQVLDQMVDAKLLAEQAKQRGIVVSADEITEEIEQLFGYQRVTPTPAPTNTPAPTATPDPNATPSGEPTPTAGPTSTPAPTPTPITLEAYQKAYKDYLARTNIAVGFTEADFRALIERDLIQQKLYEAIIKEVPTTAEQIKLRHILVAIRTPEPTPEPPATGGPAAEPTATADPNATPEPTATPTLEPRDDAQALARIIEIQQKVGAGEDFATLAAQYSDDTSSALDGGDLGWYAKGMGFVQEFEDAAFQLQPGQVSQPVQTQFGYHLIKVEERDPARELDIYTLQQKQYEAYQKWLEDIRAAAQIERMWTLDKVPSTPAPRAVQ
jgi:parvulin-like peptidyl-prolyl isomerase